MSRRLLSVAAGLFGAAMLLLAHWSCNQVIMTAPPGSSIVLFANPERIAAHGGISVISALVTEPTGFPVADGTVIQFFTSLGRIDEQARTNDGVARVNLVSDSRSGIAKVTAFSGGAASTAGGGGTATPTTTATTTTTSTATTSSGAVTGSKDVVIGNAGAATIIMNAVPNRITISRSAHVIATIVDAYNNPIPDVAVYFYVDSNTSSADTIDAGNERMDSSGNPIFTDNNGRAEDFMRTVAPEGSNYAVKVIAKTVGASGGLISGDIQITIN